MGIVLKILTWGKSNLAGLLGLLTSLIKIVRELIIIVIRILSLLMPAKFAEDTLIAKVGAIFDKIEMGLEGVTNFLLRTSGLLP